MEVKNDYPPNISEILRVFPEVKDKPGVLFCYGETIFNPSGIEIPVHLLHHESVHSDRQRSYGVKKWWEDYLSSPEFRLAEELPAHVEEYRWAVVNHPLGALRKTRQKILQGIAERLSGEFYGRLLKHEDARYLIKKEVRHENQTEAKYKPPKTGKYTPRTEDDKHFNKKDT